jgi:hypothetical protein
VVVLSIISAAAFAVGTFLGNIWPGWIDNSLCFKYLGCNEGFFGYDALIHLLGGILLAALIIFLAGKLPSLNFFQSSGLWKNIVILTSLVILIEVVWELGEFGLDRFRFYLLHLKLLHPNILSQSSSSDTMGDLFFSLVGAMITLAISKFSNIGKILIPNFKDQNSVD